MKTSQHPQLLACARALQEAKANGWSIDVIVELVIGDEARLAWPHDRDITTALYREALERDGVECMPRRT